MNHQRKGEIGMSRKEFLKVGSAALVSGFFMRDKTSGEEATAQAVSA